MQWPYTTHHALFGYPKALLSSHQAQKEVFVVYLQEELVFTWKAPGRGPLSLPNTAISLLPSPPALLSLKHLVLCEDTDLSRYVT